MIVNNQIILAASKYTGRLGVHTLGFTKISDSHISSSCHDGDQLYKQYLVILLRFWDEFLRNSGFTYQLQRVVTSSILNRFQSLDIRRKAEVPIRSFPVPFGSFDIGIVLINTTTETEFGKNPSATRHALGA